jgi:hypothetical protein
VRWVLLAMTDVLGFQGASADVVHLGPNCAGHRGHSLIDCNLAQGRNELAEQYMVSVTSARRKAFRGLWMTLCAGPGLR